MNKKILFFPGGWSKAEDSLAPQIEYFKKLPGYDVICPNIHQFDTVTKMSDYVLRSYNDVHAVVGLSMGGFIVQDILTKQPTFSSKAVIMGSFAHAQFDEAKIFFRQLINQVKSNGLEEICHLYAKDMLSDNSFLNKSDLVATVIQIPQNLGQEQCINHSEACITWDGCLDSLKQIKSKVLILAAELDKATPISGHRQLHELIANSSLQIVPNSGHFMTLEQPEIVNKFMHEWLL